MKLWRPGITGKLFLAILATCIVLLISMHWAVRISFERGFIDYIKRGNEQRLTMLGDALSEQYALHGNWKFLRNNDRFIFQLLKSFDRDNDDRFPGGRKTNAGGTPDGRLDIGPLTPMVLRRMVLRRTVHAAPARICPRTAGARFSGLSIRKDECWLARASGCLKTAAVATLWLTACRWARLSRHRSSV